jgi:hypothetical protein
MDPVAVRHTLATVVPFSPFPSWSFPMSADTTPDVRQQRAREFMQMLPLTLELAGLPKCEHGRMFTADQLDLRVTHIKNAYKLARQLVKEVSEGN